MKKNFCFGLFLILLITSCAARGPLSPKNLSPKEKEEYKVLKEAGATHEDLEAYVLYHLTPTLESQRDSIWKEFWNKRYQLLTSQEKAIYHNLPDALSKTKYLSFKEESSRKGFIKEFQEEKRGKLVKTQEGKILYYALKPLFSTDEMEEFLMTPDSLREEWLRIWWKKRDPNLTTEVNEFKEEVEQRVQHALIFFHSASGQKPWDDRGDVLILYGEPDYMEDADYYFDSEGYSSPGGRDFKRLASGSLMNQSIEDMKSRSQVWVYDKYGEFQFQDYHATGYWELAPYKREIGDDNQKVMAQFLQTKAEKIDMAKAEVKIDFGGKPLQFAWDWWRFWNEGDVYDLKVNLDIPLDELGVIADSLDPKTSWIAFTEKVAILNEESMNTVFQDSVTLRKKLPKNLNLKNLFYVDQTCLDSLKPGDYLISVSVKDSVSQKIGIYQTTAILVPHVYATGQVKISQLIMADSIWAIDSNYVAKNGAKFVRNSLVIKPRPGNVYLEGQSADYYCELYELKKGKDDSLSALVIYNLLYRTENDSLVLYAVPDSEYASWSADGGKPFLKGKLNLPPGEYILHLIVYDLNDPKAKKEDIRETAARFSID